jgi:DSF synthase
MKIEHRNSSLKESGKAWHDDTESNSDFTQFTTRYDSETSSIWCWLSPEPRPCLNVTLVDEMMLLQQQLTTTYKAQESDAVWPFQHLILASQLPGVYSLGGDLHLFKQCIENNDEATLRDYAYKCVFLAHSNIDNLDLPITTVSLVQGQALGGGFELALSSDVIIAERSSQLGFPEILFNLFPGMGAYNLLSRRIGSALAERMILSGRTYSAAELYDIGIVDILAEDGQGVQATENYMKSHNQSHNTIRSIKKIRQIVHPITRQELVDIVDIWIDASMKLSKKDLAKMERLLYLQTDVKNTKNIRESAGLMQARHGDWRKVTGVTFPLTTHLGVNVSKNRRKNKSRRQETEEIS